MGCELKRLHGNLSFYRPRSDVSQLTRFLTEAVSSEATIFIFTARVWRKILRWSVAGLFLECLDKCLFQGDVNNCRPRDGTSFAL
jgi:hypothetical protein